MAANHVHGRLGRQRWHLLGVALAVQTGLSVAEMGLPVLLGFIRDDLGLRTSVASLIVSAYYGGKFLGSYVAGWTADRVGEVRVLVVGAMVAGALVVGASTASLVGLFPLLAVAGFAGAGSTPAGGRLVWQTFPPDQRGLALGIRQTGVPLGGVAAAAVLPLTAHAVGWRPALAAAGVVAFLSAVPILAMRDARRLDASLGRARPGTRTAVNREVRILTAWGCLVMTGQFAVLTYLPLDAHARAHLSLPAAGLLVAIAQGSGIAGRVLWGALSDKTRVFGHRALLMTLTLSSLLASLLLLALPGRAPIAVWGLAAIVVGITVIGFQGLWVTMLAEVADPDAVGTATGFAVMCTIGAVTLTPPLYGAFAEAAGSVRAVWLLLAGVLAVSLLPVTRLGGSRVQDPSPTPDIA